MSSSQSTESRGAWLFRKMAGIFGARFVDMWRDVDPVDAHATWTQATRELSREALQRGIATCYHMRAAPTLPEFLAACSAQPAIVANRTLTDETNRTPAPVARERLAEAMGMIGGMTPGIAWAYRLIERSERGEHITTLQLVHAREAIEAWSITHTRIEREREPGCDDDEMEVRP
jgi:hypothetical protein